GLTRVAVFQRRFGLDDLGVCLRLGLKLGTEASRHRAGSRRRACFDKPSSDQKPDLHGRTGRERLVGGSNGSAVLLSSELCVSERGELVGGPMRILRPQIRCRALSEYADGLGGAAFLQRQIAQP